MTTTTVANETSEGPRDLWDFLPTDLLTLAGAYSPLPYRQGDICERCWMQWRTVVAIGKFGCDHK